MLAVVHLVTLGWITSHILGALYLIAPMALGPRLRITRADRVAFWIFAVGVVGMVGHFWIGEMRGMVWPECWCSRPSCWSGRERRPRCAARRSTAESSSTTGWRSSTSSAPACSGIVLGLNRVTPVPRRRAALTALRPRPPGRARLGDDDRVRFRAAAAADAAAVGAAAASTAWASAALLEIAVVGLAWCFLAGGAGLRWFAVIGARRSVVWFLGLVVWMLRHRRRPGPGLPSTRLHRLYAIQALLYLAAATGIGLALAFAPRSLATLRLAKVYAVCGLFGFMGTMILGVAGRHVPVLFWTRAVRRIGSSTPLSPYRLRPQPLQLSSWPPGPRACRCSRPRCGSKPRYRLRAAASSAPGRRRSAARSTTDGVAPRARHLRGEALLAGRLLTHVRHQLPQVLVRQPLTERPASACRERRRR